MEQLILKYLNKELTSTEERELQSWLEEDSLNRQVFENMVSHWELSDMEVNAYKQRVFDRVMQSGPIPVIEIENNSAWSNAWKVAAVILLAIGLGFVFNHMENQIQPMMAVVEQVLIEKEALFGQKLTFELPDGSIVKLNSGSKITFPKAFDTDQREVTLIGEAFFDVTKDPQRPFKIATDNIDVTVLGTSFNVDAYADNKLAVVAVKTGKVAVVDKNGKDEVLLLPNQQASLSKQELKFKKQQITNSESVFGWLDQTMMFDDDTIDEIIITLERWYDVEVEIMANLDKKKKFTAKYKNPTLRAVMESLSYAYDFKYELKDKTVIIK